MQKSKHGPVDGAGRYPEGGRVMIPEPKDNPNGLHARYVVTKKNGEPVDPNAVYFVLRLDGGGDDKQHIEACRIAALAYAEAIRANGESHLLQLARELQAAVFRFSAEAVQCSGSTA